MDCRYAKIVTLLGAHLIHSISSETLFCIDHHLLCDDELQMTLRARVGRNVDGRDEKLFDKVVQLRRNFEKEQKAHQG